MRLNAYLLNLNSLEQFTRNLIVKYANVSIMLMYAILKHANEIDNLTSPKRLTKLYTKKIRKMSSVAM